jgi:hypothetical protein
MVFNDAHLNAFAPFSSIRSVEIDATQVRAIGETLFHVQVSSPFGTPKQIRSRLGGHLPELIAREQTVGQAQHAFAQRR